MPKTRQAAVANVKPKTSLKGKVIKRKSMRQSGFLKLTGLIRKQVLPEQLEFIEQSFSESEEDFSPTLGAVIEKKLGGPINCQQIEDGVKALFEYVEETTEGKTTLLDDEQPIFLQVTSIKVPKTPNRQMRLNLKHSLLTESSEICLIVSDIGKPKEHEETIEHYEKLLEAHGITNIKTIMPFHQFKTEYGNQYELKRKFLGLYDYFLVDGKVSGKVIHLLGKIFLEKRKAPAVVKMHATNLKRHFEKSLNKTLMKIHSKADSYAVQIGHTKMSSEEVDENAVMIVDELSKQFPGGIDNIRSLGIKTDKSITVPLYLTLKNKSSLKTPVEEPKLPKQYRNATGELTTYLHRDVTVLPTGDVYITNISSDADTDEEEQWNDDEEELGDGLAGELSDDDEAVGENPVPQQVIKKKGKGKKGKAKDEIEDDADSHVVDQAEEVYLNQYEEEQTNTRKMRKTKAAEVQNLSNGAPLKKIKKQVKVVEEKAPTQRASKRSARNASASEPTNVTKRKQPKASKETNGEGEHDDIALAQAEEMYLNQYEQEKATTKKTRKPKANQTSPKGTVASKKGVKAKKAVKIRVKLPHSSPPANKKKGKEQQVAKPETKKQKAKTKPEKTNENTTEPVVLKVPRKTKASIDIAEVPAKKSKNVTKIENVETQKPSRITKKAPTSLEEQKTQKQAPKAKTSSIKAKEKIEVAGTTKTKVKVEPAQSQVKKESKAKKTVLEGKNKKENNRNSLTFKTKAKNNTNKEGIKSKLKKV